MVMIIFRTYDDMHTRSFRARTINKAGPYMKACVQHLQKIHITRAYSETLLNDIEII